MHTEQESHAFISECEFAIEQLFQVLAHRQKAISQLNQTLAEIEHAEEVLASVFIERDQWSPNANFYHAQYMDRMKALAEEKKGIATTDEEKKKRTEELLARIGATEESMAVLAGAILQIAKQVLSFRFDAKPQVQSARKVGSQSVVELIWEGRNHALHWEDPNPRQPTRDMLRKLKEEIAVKIVSGNNALAILASLEWSSAVKVVKELQALVK